VVLPCPDKMVILSLNLLRRQTQYTAVQPSTHQAGFTRSLWVLAKMSLYKYKAPRPPLQTALFAPSPSLFLVP
jgi:hypothetical protein